jgi:hypothetical protein
MTSQNPNTEADTGGDAGPGSPPRMPGWVKVSLLIVGALILLFIILKVAGVGGGMGGEHGPGRHASGVQTPTSSLSTEAPPSEEVLA